MTHYVYVTSGTGPVECQIALERFLEHLNKEAVQHSVAYEELVQFPGKEGHLKAAIISLTGLGASTLVKSYAGTIKIMFSNRLRVGAARKNWFIGLFSLDMPDIPTTLDERDLEFETFRAGGPGGQHQNTTDSAVRVRHKPTGITVVSREQRSQHANKKKAISLLEATLSSMQDQKASDHKKSIFHLNKSVERGNAVQTLQF